MAINLLVAIHLLICSMTVTAKVEKPYNQLKEHLESCLTKYNDLDSALGPFFLMNFCFLQVFHHIML